MTFNNNCKELKLSDRASSEKNLWQDSRRKTPAEKLLL